MMGWHSSPTLDVTMANRSMAKLASNNGANGGLVPASETAEDFNATGADDCGCQFQVTGNGCFKIRDFSALPGFEADTRQAFILINETCSENPETPTSGADNHAMIMSALVAATLMFMNVVSEPLWMV